jgi:hypothetical protein
MSSGSVTYGTIDRIGGTKMVKPENTTFIASCSVDGGKAQTYTFDMEGTHTAPLSQTKLEDVYDKVRLQAHAARDAPIECSLVTPLSSQTANGSKNEHDWIHHRMARNCAPRFNLNDVTAYNEFRCKYMGKGLVDGKMVHNPFKEWKGKLASCDGFREYMEISDDLMRDIRDFAYDAAGGDEAKLDREMFACQVQSLPLH